MNHTMDELQLKWSAFAQAKERILACMETLSEEQAHAQPLSGWRAVQDIEHILYSEKGTLGYIQKKTSSGWESLEDQEDEHRLKAQALHERLRSNEKYPAPAVLPEPTNSPSLEEMHAEWNAIRGQWNQWFESVDSAYLHKLIFKQPAAGMLTLADTLTFLTLHIEHHIPQIEANVTALA